MHSEECLEFLPRYLNGMPGMSRITERTDFKRAFWTPPLDPAAALAVEQRQIARLKLTPLVSLTDHDNIEAGFALEEVPISVEWTVPYRRSILHLGIHNLPRGSARFWGSTMAAFTAAPAEERLPEILKELASLPETLVVLNHPFWLEEGVLAADHSPALEQFLRECVEFVHAFELNGTRPWKENRDTIELAAAHNRPMISGGDRHACEPSACLNLTNAKSFAEFATEVRDGESSVVFMPHYRQPMGLRILEASCEILASYPEYPTRRRWIDRFFYRSENGHVQSLAEVWENREPWMLKPATGTLRLLGTNGVRGALRAVFSQAG